MPTDCRPMNGQKMWIFLLPFCAFSSGKKLSEVSEPMRAGQLACSTNASKLGVILG